MGPGQPGVSMPFVPLAGLLFLLGDVFEGYQQQDDPASVPLLTPHAGGGHKPATTVGCARAASVFQGLRGGAQVQQMGNCSSAAGRPNPGSG